jgi:hypothetical protein
MEKEAPYIFLSRLERGLADLVGEAVDQPDPASAVARALMVVVAPNPNGGVILPVTVDDHPAMARNLCQQSNKAQMSAVMKKEVRLKDDNEGVRRRNIRGASETGGYPLGSIEDDLMPKFPGYLGVVINVLRTPLVVQCVADEEQSHCTFSPTGTG